jgi:hypothetical protein
MAGRPATIRQREVKQIILGAQKAGASKVTLRIGGNVEAVIDLSTPEEKTVAQDDQITL